MIRIWIPRNLDGAYHHWPTMALRSMVDQHTYPQVKYRRVHVLAVVIVMALVAQMAAMGVRLSIIECQRPPKLQSCRPPPSQLQTSILTVKMYTLLECPRTMEMSGHQRYKARRLSIRAPPALSFPVRIAVLPSHPSGAGMRAVALFAMLAVCMSDR